VFPAFLYYLNGQAVGFLTKLTAKIRRGFLCLVNFKELDRNLSWHNRVADISWSDCPTEEKSLCIVDQKPEALSFA